MKRKFTIDPRLVDIFVKTWNKYHPEEEVYPHSINWGWCYQFALLVHKVYGKEKVKLCSDLDGGHCWVKVGRLYYDSAHLEGAKYCLNMDGLFSKNLSEEDICEIWHERGNSGPVDYKVLEYAFKRFKRLKSGK